MDFRVLGPLEVRDGDREVPLGGPMQRAVLAILLLRAGEVVAQEGLIDELWGDRPPETAANTLHGYISHLRQALGKDVIVSRDPGYVLRAEPGSFDLQRFERLAARGRDALEAGRAEEAAELSRQALSLWRGAALADFAGEPFALTESARLDELRLAVLEQRIEADLALGRHAELVGELEALVVHHPYREGPRRQLMLALYRSARQAEALGAFREARAALVERLGIEPGPALQELERAILRHDPGLDLTQTGALVQGGAVPLRSIVAVPTSDRALGALVSLGAVLAREPARELVVVRPVAGEDDLGAATAALAELRDRLAVQGVEGRVAAHTSHHPGDDAVLLATELDADLLLVDAPPSLLEEGRPGTELSAVLAGAPCDVGVVVVRGESELAGSGPVAVPFGGSSHDWSAVEIAAWAARSLGVSLRLLGASADHGGRDASRLLAHASLVVQAAVGIVAEPALARDDAEALLAATDDASLLVVPLSERWPSKGLGPTRLEVVRSARIPALLVRGGLRPGGLAPPENLTRFTWTIAAG